MQATASDGGATAWEVSTASSVGSSIYLYNGTTWTEQVGEDGVYSFIGLCEYSSLEYDCSDIGEYTVNIMVTDEGGNEVISPASIIVSDITYPELVCGPDSTLFGSVSDNNLGVSIPDNNPVGISLTIDVTDDFLITDINVPINISHTFSGDLLIKLTSPAGTMITLRNPTGFNTPDIIETYDDEGVVPVDALSIFDGESTLGTWTLFVSDNENADTGVINSWGIEYSFPNPTSELFIELDENGEHHLTLEDMTDVATDNCGITAHILSVTDVDCTDIGAPISVNVLVTDASSHVLSCDYDINVVDWMEPELICPGDMTGENAVTCNNEGIYYLPDYNAIGLAFAVDNCTGTDSIIFDQTPVPGTPFGINVGTIIPYYIISFTAEDENGNIANCEFELAVRSPCDVNEISKMNQLIKMVLPRML